MTYVWYCSYGKIGCTVKLVDDRGKVVRFIYKKSTKKVCHVLSKIKYGALTPTFKIIVRFH